MLIRRLHNCLFWVHLVFHQGDIVKKITLKVEGASEKEAVCNLGGMVIEGGFRSSALYDIRLRMVRNKIM